VIGLGKAETGEFAVGTFVAIAVGVSVMGFAVGIAGTLVGASVGALVVGELVGLSVGTWLGESVGALVVGELVGLSVGTWLGESVGALVVGELVGLSAIKNKNYQLYKNLKLQEIKLLISWWIKLIIFLLNLAQ
jgi:hypothetical protein